ncbi:MAG: hypothetical protein WCP65_00780 [Bacteroidota bacterium]|jgi:hypothetical protein
MKTPAYFHSGYITFRKRNIGILYSGQTAEHIMDNYILEPISHPLKHIRIQQLAKNIDSWEKKGNNRYAGIVTDNKNGIKHRIIVEVYTTFAMIITCFKY